MHVRLVKTIDFEAAHFLPTFPEGHKCRRLHGHSYKVDIVVEGEVPPEQGYLIDYAEIKVAFEPLKQQLDHSCLNEVEGLTNPTSEMIAKWIWDRLKPRLPLLAEVVIHETCSSRCEYRGPGAAP